MVDKTKENDMEDTEADKETEAEDDSDVTEVETKADPKGKKEPVKESVELDYEAFERIVPVFEATNGEISSDAVSVLFEGQDLSEEFKTKASTIFEAALNHRLQEAVESIEEQAQEVLAERVELIEDTLVEQLNDYVTDVVTEWKEENAIELEQGIISEKAESFIADLKTLMETHNVFLSEAEGKELEAEKAKTAELEAELCEALELIASLQEELFEQNKAKAFADLSEGLADTQVEKFKKLLEGFDFETVDAFVEKATIVKEAFVTKADSSTENKKKMLNEEVEIDNGPSENMKRYISAAKKSKTDY